MSLEQLPRPQALIFDLDGTLVDSVGLRIEAWLRTFDENDLAAERDHVAGMIGADGRRLAREVAEAAGRELDERTTEEIDRRAGETYSELNTDPQPLPGVRELLLALDESGFTWAIATSSRAEQVLSSVEGLRLPRLPKITDGSHVEHAKPAPDLLLHAAQELGSCAGRVLVRGRRSLGRPRRPRGPDALPCHRQRQRVGRDTADSWCWRRHYSRGSAGRARPPRPVVAVIRGAQTTGADCAASRLADSARPVAPA
ncbi:hypothetical protein BH24CHL6_BH24CHL6_05360 [soil metagenome]